MKKKVCLVFMLVGCMLITACANENNNNNNNNSSYTESEEKKNNFYLKNIAEISNILSSGYTQKYDEVDNKYTFTPVQSWGGRASLAGYIYPLINISGEDKATGVVYKYTGSDWVFFDKIIIKTDSNRYEKDFDYYEVDRDTSSLGDVHIEEKVARSLDSDTYEMLKDIASSSKTILRFSGEEGYRDRELTQENKAQIQRYLECFEEN